MGTTKSKPVTRLIVKGIVQEFTQLDMENESKNAFMEIIIKFFITKLVKDNHTMATPESYEVGEEGPKDFYLKEDDDGSVKKALESDNDSDLEGEMNLLSDDLKLASKKISR